MSEKYRLITRNDFDGMVCAILLKKLDLIDDILFVHPRDMQHGRIKVSKKDISANLPYTLGIYMAFDHHESEDKRVGRKRTNFICDKKSPSAARVIYRYFEMDKKFPGLFEEMLDALDKADTANFSKEDIINPSGWALFNFIFDPKTGFERFHDFEVSHDKLVRSMVKDWNGQSVDEILQMPAMMERIHMYRTYQSHFISQIERCALCHKNLVIVDLQNEEIVYPGNRFMVYALYPQCDLSLFIQKEEKEGKATLSLAKSILKRTSPINVGELMLKYSGGGHIGAGTCQTALDEVEQTKMELIADILEAYEMKRSRV